MTRLRIFLARLRGLGRSRRLERELRQEIAGHLDEAAEDYVRQGLSPEDARRAALRNLGGISQTEEAYRDHVAFLWLDQLRADARHALRALRRSAAFSIVVLIVLAIGTGAITSVFALLHSVVLRPLPLDQPDRLVSITHAAPGLNQEEVGLSGGLYRYYSEQAQSFESIGVYTERVLNLRAPGAGTERVQVTMAGVGFFRTLRVRPILGRSFTDEDGGPGFMNISNWTVPVMLAHDFWVTRFGSDPNIAGRILTLNESPRVVVGVLPEDFRFPGPHTQIWMLSEIPPQTTTFARNFSLSSVARMRSGVTVAAARGELERILPQIVGAYVDATPDTLAKLRLAPIVTPLKTAIIGDTADVLWTLFGGMALLLVIATANAASLFAVRAEERRREVAVRQALGAHRHRVARLFFTEALLLTVTAAALGLVLTKAFLWLVRARAPVELPRAPEIGLDMVTIVFALGMAVLMAVFYGALAVRRQTRTFSASLLSGHWSTGDRGGRWARDPFVVLQVALALSLLVGSALMVKTYAHLSRTPLGFSSERMLTVEISLPGRKASQHVRIYQEVVDRIRRLPGVETVSAASFTPLTGSEHVFPTHAGDAPIPFKFFMPGYFQTMKTRIIQGVGLNASEPVEGPRPVIVSAALARRLFPDTNAIGKSVYRLEADGRIVEMGRGPEPPFTIAGVAENVRETTLRNDPMEIVYIPLIEPTVEPSIVPTNMSLVIRTHVAPLTLAASARDTITSVDPTLSVGRIRTMESIVQAARATEAFVGLLLLLAAAVSLFLGSVGIYGGVAHVVRQRTREIGIRLALGARRADVVRMVVSGSLAAVSTGAVLGLVAAVAGGRMLRALLFGVEPGDPAVVLTATAVLLSTGLAAALLAARRATGIAPLRAMRDD